jgi:hypothetical protein
MYVHYVGKILFFTLYSALCLEGIMYILQKKKLVHHIQIYATFSSSKPANANEKLKQGPVSITHNTVACTPVAM